MTQTGRNLQQELADARELLASLVAEFLAWRSERDLPSVTELLQHPRTFNWPTSPDQREALLHAVVQSARRGPIGVDDPVGRWRQAAEVVVEARRLGRGSSAAAALAIYELCPPELSTDEARRWQKRLALTASASEEARDDK